jgi:hypothetical protein
MPCFIALLSVPSTIVNCRSLNTPRSVAWHLDLSSCSTPSVFRDELNLRLARAFASFFIALAMWMKGSQKSSIGLMWTPSIWHDLLGGRYLMWVSSAIQGYRVDLVL